MGDGFYDRVFEKYFGETHKTFFKGMITSGLFNSKTDQIKEKWNLFFDEIETNIDALPEIPFTFVIRNDFSFETNAMDLIDLAIEKIKQDIVMNVIRNKGVIPTSLNNTLLLYLYCLFIKRDCVVANLDASNQHLLDLINQKKSGINDLMYPIESIYNTNGVGPLFKEFFMSQMATQSELIKDYFAFIENLGFALKNIEKLKLMIANITEKLADHGSLLNNGDTQLILHNLSSLQAKCEKLEIKKDSLQRELNVIDCNDKMNRDGWPETKVARGFYGRRLVFFMKKHTRMIWLFRRGCIRM